MKMVAISSNLCPSSDRLFASRVVAAPWFYAPSPRPALARIVEPGHQLTQLRFIMGRGSPATVATVPSAAMTNLTGSPSYTLWTPDAILTSSRCAPVGFPPSGVTANLIERPAHEPTTQRDGSASLSRRAIGVSRDANGAYNHRHQRSQVRDMSDRESNQRNSAGMQRSRRTPARQPSIRADSCPWR